MSEPFDLPAAIKARGSYAEAAVACGLDQTSSIARWCTGESVPPPARQVALAAWLGVDVATVAAWCAQNAPVRGRR